MTTPLHQAAGPAPACAAATCRRSLRDHELAAQQLLCGPCVHLIGVWLTAELPRQITVLEASRERETTGVSAGGRTVHPTAPLPGRADILNLLGPAAWDDTVRDPYGEAREDQHGAVPIAGTLTAWARVICDDERHWNPPTSTSPLALAAWLARPAILGWAARRPWAGDLHDELDSMMRTIRATTRISPRRRAVPQPCPRCDSLTLVETDHQLYVECSDENCQALYTRDELAVAARLSVDRGSRVCLTKDCAGATYEVPTGHSVTRIHYCPPNEGEGEQR
ncbi:hypothetical protein [Streptomyces sp. CRN 30]|uniref:hypothetical protein n=1 Tax=Streptomyces sp. CRN 30 TaxID=3075613 RepID=UPI002A8159D3|nr:hypothetical protein [Streptomyces sp. CRN 30]